jgi:hypothetical protein
VTKRYFKTFTNNILHKLRQKLVLKNQIFKKF